MIITRDNLQRAIGSTFSFSNGTTMNETVSLASQTNTITGDTITQGGKTATSTYQYDHAGRLTNATIDNWQFQYGFGSQAAACTSLPGYNPNAYKNGNRTTTTKTNTVTNTATTTTNCYNTADQLTQSTDTQIGTPTYDDHGNTTTLAGAGSPITFTYNATDQNTKIQQGNNSTEYTKSPTGQVLTKKEYRNGTLDKLYRNTSGILLTCDTLNQSNCSITDRYITLPGGVTLTLSPTNPDTTKQVIYSIQNFHGDTTLTTNQTGLPTSSIYLYDPFGQTITSNTFGTGSTNPTNASDNSMSWATSPNRKAESLFTIPIIQMGARVYLPTLGRFLQVDPIEGGTETSNFAYKNSTRSECCFSWDAKQFTCWFCGLRVFWL